MNMTISTRLWLGFGALVGLTLLMSAYSLSKLGQVRDITATISQNDRNALNLIRQVQGSQDQMKVQRERSLGLFLGKKAGIEPSSPLGDPHLLWREARNRTQAYLQELEAVAGTEGEQISPERIRAWQGIAQASREALEILRQVSEEVERQFQSEEEDLVEAVLAATARIQPLRDAFDAKVGEAAQLTERLAQAGTGAAAGAYEQARSSILGAIVVAFLLAVAGIVLIQRSITAPLAQFMRVTERVGQGDLSLQAAVSGKDELSRLGENLNRMRDGLRRLALQIRQATESLGSMSAEILASTQQQVASTSEQAAAVQQTTATMEEVTQSGAQVSQRAKEVASSAEATSTVSAAGLRAVEQMVAIMESIRQQAESVAQNIVLLSEKTQAVGEIIATVNDIAEQSNLLALNAAIEAAAAGEGGRSFSVVAREMKNLADQAKEATVQVRSILGEIQKGINTSVMLTEEAVKRVDSGRTQAESVDRTIREMAAAIEESVRAFQQIVASGAQQQIGFEQVTEALKNIRQATEQTAAGTRQLEEAAAGLNQLAKELRKAVEAYRV